MNDAERPEQERERRGAGLGRRAIGGREEGMVDRCGKVSQLTSILRKGCREEGEGQRREGGQQAS